MVKLYLDADVDPLVASDLRGRGRDIIAARDVGMLRATDPEHLEFAAREGRTLLTFNTRHFVPLYREWWREGRSHAGILVSRHYERNEIGELLRLVENVFRLATEADLANQLRFLTEFDV